MITLLKKELEPVAILLQAFGMVNGTLQPVHGLLYEEIPLSLKRRLQRIRKDVMAKKAEQENDIAEINKKFPIVVAKKNKPLTKKEMEANEANEASRKKEMEILMNEEVTIDQEHVSLEMIEAIQTKFNYDFELIEKIAV